MSWTCSVDHKKTGIISFEHLHREDFEQLSDVGAAEECESVFIPRRHMTKTEGILNSKHTTTRT